MRLNYGYSASKLNSVCLVEGFVFHHFHLRLPTTEPTEHTMTSRPATNTTTECGAVCLRMTALHQSLADLASSMKSAVQKVISKVNSIIYDKDSEPTSPFARRRFPKAIIDGAGYFLRWVGGVATMDDIHDLKAAMEIVSKTASLASTETIRVRQGLATFSRVTNQRLDRLQTVLEEELQSIGHLYQRAQLAYDTAFIEFNALSIALSEIQSFSQIYTDLSALENSLEKLLEGALSPTLVSMAQMTDVFAMASSKLTPAGRTLCYKTVQEIYAAKNVLYARHHSDLLIRIKIPYTSMPRFTAYRSILLDLPVHSRQGFKTRLEAVPELFVH